MVHLCLRETKPLDSSLLHSLGTLARESICYEALPCVGVPRAIYNTFVFQEGMEFLKIIRLPTENLLSIAGESILFKDILPEPSYCFIPALLLKAPLNVSSSSKSSKSLV